MPQAGLLVQFDASQHDWLEGCGPRLALHGAIDDATNQVPAAVFRAEEDAQGYFLILRALVATSGVPVAIYSDRHGIFQRTWRHPLTLDEQLRGERAPTQVGRALRELRIRWILASSPQAKGRIERLWGTFQDRLVSELRRARARTLEEANAVLATFLPRYNARFAQAPADPISAYRPWPPDVDLDDICCFTYERTVTNDNTVHLGPHLLQILPGPRRQSYARAGVAVREHLDGMLTVSNQHQRVALQHLTSSLRHESGDGLRARGGRRLHPAPPTPPEPRRLGRRRGRQPSIRGAGTLPRGHAGNDSVRQE